MLDTMTWVGMIRARILLKNSLVSHLILIIQHIEHYDKPIQELMSDIPNGNIFTSLYHFHYLAVHYRRDRNVPSIG